MTQHFKRSLVMNAIYKHTACSVWGHSSGHYPSPTQPAGLAQQEWPFRLPSSDKLGPGGEELLDLKSHANVSLLGKSTDLQSSRAMCLSPHQWFSKCGPGDHGVRVVPEIFSGSLFP